MSSSASSAPTLVDRAGPAQLAFIACSGLLVIVMAQRRQASRLVVVKGPRHVQRVFEICNLVRMLPLIEKFPDDVVSPPRR